MHELHRNKPLTSVHAHTHARIQAYTQSHACMHTCHTSRHAHAFVHACRRARMYAHACTFVCLQAQASACTHVCVHAHARMYISACVCAHSTCTYVCVYAHTHVPLRKDDAGEFRGTVDTQKVQNQRHDGTTPTHGQLIQRPAQERVCCPPSIRSYMSPHGETDQTRLIQRPTQEPGCCGLFRWSSEGTLCAALRAKAHCPQF